MIPPPGAPTRSFLMTWKFGIDTAESGTDSSSHDSAKVAMSGSFAIMLECTSSILLKIERGIAGGYFENDWMLLRLAAPFVVRIDTKVRGSKAAQVSVPVDEG